MKVKVKNTIYDGEEEIIMVILTEQDKKNIYMMPTDVHRYCIYPSDKISADEALDWMKSE